MEDNLKNTLDIKETTCEHQYTIVIPEGSQGMLGTVICLDCGYTREWGAY